MGKGEEAFRPAPPNLSIISGYATAWPFSRFWYIQRQIMAWPWNQRQWLFKVIGNDTIWELGYDFIFTFHSNYGSNLHHFGDKVRYWSKIEISSYRPCIQCPVRIPETDGRTDRHLASCDSIVRTVHLRRSVKIIWITYNKFQKSLESDKRSSQTDQPIHPQLQRHLTYRSLSM